MNNLNQLNIKATGRISFFVSNSNDLRFDDIQKCINSYSNLKEGWDHGEGCIINSDVIRVALGIYDMGKSYEFQVEPFPMTDGGIRLIFYKPNNNHFINVEVSANLTINFKHNIGFGYPYKTETEVEDATESDLREIFKSVFNLCGSSEFYGTISLARLKADFSQMPSPNSMVEYLLSQKIVSPPIRNQFANT